MIVGSFIKEEIVVSTDLAARLSKDSIKGESIDYIDSKAGLKLEPVRFSVKMYLIYIYHLSSLGYEHF